MREVGVAIDETSPDHPALPEVFRKLQWQRLPEAEVTRELVAVVRQLFRRYHRSMAEWV